MPATVQPERILRDLTELWHNLASAEGKPTASGVLRACSMTLIVAADDPGDAVEVEQTLAELMHEHPSRAIVLKPGPSGDGLDARVFAQCWMPFGSRQQICCEEIEITTPEDSLEQASRVILGLLTPDLPAVLWVRGDHWFDRAGFEQLYPLIDKIVVDSCSFGNGARAFELIDALRTKGPLVADLAWTRLTGWRETIANSLEGPGAKMIGSVREIVVDHYKESPAVSVYYLAAWLAGAFQDASVRFERVEGTEGQIAGVRLRGDGVDVGFRRLDGDAIQVTGTTSIATLLLPHATDSRSMQEELTIRGRDPVFEAVYRRTGQLRLQVS